MRNTLDATRLKILGRSDWSSFFGAKSAAFPILDFSLKRLPLGWIQAGLEKGIQIDGDTKFFLGFINDPGATITGAHKRDDALDPFQQIVKDTVVLLVDRMNKLVKAGEMLLDKV